VTTGTHSATFRDRSGEVVGRLTILRYVNTNHERSAVWACRCDCGRPDCKREVERSSHRLRGLRMRASCREFPRTPRPPKPPPSPWLVLLPEGVRQPWSRSAGEREDRDARLEWAFAHGAAA
jgi:hypothetical protein